MAAQPDTKVERDLLRLVYASLAAPGLTDDDLESIEASSAGRNRAAGLTGLLLHQGGSFFALLEGPRRRSPPAASSPGASADCLAQRRRTPRPATTSFASSEAA